MDIENRPFAAERSRVTIAKLESNLRKGGMLNKGKKFEFSLFCVYVPVIHLLSSLAIFYQVIAKLQGAHLSLVW